MSDWRSLKRDPPAYVAIFRLLALVGGISAGIILGWKNFFGPQKIAPSEQAAEVVGNNNLTPTLWAVPVQETGVPANAIGQAVRVGSAVPGFKLMDLEGNVHALNDHRDQVVLINFWTTWCPPCRAEMPALQEAYDRYREQGFFVLGVNWTDLDDREQIEPFIQGLGLTFPILLDNDSYVSENLYQLIGLPTSVFVGRDGIVREVFIGALQLENLESKIQTMLEEIL